MTTLEHSYARCRELNKAYGTTYYAATFALPRVKRHHVHALYGFCRYADDIVDDLGPAPVEVREKALADFGERFFTDLAAGEMKLRLRGELEAARAEASPEEQARLTAALGKLEAAPIGTIHSFCADLLRERPVEARVDPVFEVAANEAQERLFDQAFESWFQRVVADPPEGVRRLLRRKVRPSDTPPRELLRQAGRDLVEHRDFDGAWRRDAFDRAAGLLYIGDVGQGAWEEVDVQPASQSGLNYGWRIV